MAPQEQKRLKYICLVANDDGDADNGEGDDDYGDDDNGDDDDDGDDNAGRTSRSGNIKCPAASRWSLQRLASPGLS